MKEMEFEKAFERLEEILQNMNENKISLDNSLKLFEEADLLIKTCNKKLLDAESKIETLIKNRDQDLKIDENGPVKENFNMDTNQVL
ncbi:MAG: Exodeoxyribonuclease 7 small subunit [Candidatus Anoxychlamydiales bacterium]|nr:Exodeoxyribonuclease 7 small subunit [Candidatus Anoxychlamydiales bacterium]